MRAAHCKAARSPASGAETRRRALPWNDSSKPAQKPGPWDAPSQDDRGVPTDGKGRAPQPSVESGSSDRGRPLTPWGREETVQKPRPVRRPGSIGRKPAEPGAAPSPRGPHLDELTRQVRTMVARAVLRPSGRGLRAGVVGGLLVALTAAWGLSVD